MKGERGRRKREDELLASVGEDADRLETFCTVSMNIKCGCCCL